MFGTFSEQLKNSTKPAHTLLELNAKALESLAQQQTELFTGLLSDGVKYMETVSVQPELKTILAANSDYAASMRERLSSASKETYSTLNDVREQVTKVMTTSLAHTSEEVQKQTQATAETVQKAAQTTQKKAQSTARATAKSTEQTAKKAVDTAVATTQKATEKTAEATQKTADTTKDTIEKAAATNQKSAASATPSASSGTADKKTASGRSRRTSSSAKSSASTKSSS